jgi:hypothetical protein
MSKTPEELFNQQRYIFFSKVFHNTITQVKKFWKKRNSPAFLRIEGGIFRPVFISGSAEVICLLPIEGINENDITNPIKEIDLLIDSKKQKREMLATFDRLLPGCALILIDSDSEDFESRTKKWFIT